MDDAEFCFWVSFLPGNECFGPFFGITFEFKGKELTIPLFNPVNFLLIVGPPEIVVRKNIVVMLKLYSLADQIIRPKFCRVRSQPMRIEIVDEHIAQPFVVKVPTAAFRHLFSQVSAEATNAIDNKYFGQ